MAELTPRISATPRASHPLFSQSPRVIARKAVSLLITPPYHAKAHDRHSRSCASATCRASPPITSSLLGVFASPGRPCTLAVPARRPPAPQGSHLIRAVLDLKTTVFPDFSLPERTPAAHVLGRGPRALVARNAAQSTAGVDVGAAQLRSHGLPLLPGVSRRPRTRPAARTGAVVAFHCESAIADALRSQLDLEHE
jgi:hypothetical protein